MVAGVSWFLLLSVTRRVDAISATDASAIPLGMFALILFPVSVGLVMVSF